MAVHGVPQATDQFVCGYERVTPGTFSGIDDLKVHAHALGHRDEMVVTVRVILRRCQANPAAVRVVVNGIFFVACQLVVERDGMRFEAHHGLHRTEVGDLSRGVPGGA